MTEKTVVYIKPDEEPIVPVTVRIEWRPDGSIRPLEFWMPDNTHFRVVHVYECTPRAFLKKKAEGVRFKLKAKNTAEQDTYHEHRYIEIVTYLVFASNMYCEKNIIDSRYGHPGKEYIPVVLDVFPSGDYELVYFWVKGTRYKVEKTITIDVRGTFKTGGIGLRHEVDVRLVNNTDDEDPDQQNCVRRMAALYWELNKWFVAVA